MKQVLMVGRGKTGLSVEAYCKRNGISCTFYEDQTPLSINDALKNVDTLIVSPSMKTSHPLYQEAKNRGINVLSDIDIFFKSNPKCVGITGTNGKSTTTALLGHVLKDYYPATHVGGNIGIPVLDLPEEENALYVLELSSYQLEHSAPLPLRCSILLNITPDHIEHHGSMEAYIEAKTKIFKMSDYPILCIDDEYTNAIYNQFLNKKDVITLSTKERADYWIKEQRYAMQHDVCLMDLSNITLKGEHNHQNILAVFAACHVFGLSNQQIASSIESFKGLEHRQEYVTQSQNILFINDSKATNAEATEKALTAYSDYEIYWILGGVEKEGDIQSLKHYLSPIHKAYLIGDSVEKIKESLIDFNVPYIECHTLDKAVKQSFMDASSSKSKAKVILLSPACASFDQFENFEHRGKEFKDMVFNL